jgi:hypothetical protein
MHAIIIFPLKISNIYAKLNFTYSYLKFKEKSLSEDQVSHLDVLMRSLETVYSHLKNKKGDLKMFLEYINANNSYEFRILVKNKMINRSSRSRIAIRKKLSEILRIYIGINKRMIKRINFAWFVELNFN